MAFFMTRTQLINIILLALIVSGSYTFGQIEIKLIERNIVIAKFAINDEFCLTAWS